MENNVEHNKPSYEELERMLNALTEKDRAKDQLINDLTLENERLKELVALRQKELFARKKDSLTDCSGTQMTLFDDAELAMAECKAETEYTEVKGHKRLRSVSLVNAEVNRLPIESKDVLVENPPEGAREIGWDTLDRVSCRPEAWFIKRTRYQKMAVDNDDGTTSVISARQPSVLAMDGSMADEAAAAHIVAQKYVLSLPLYRMEQECKRLGIPLSRQTMSNIIYAADGALGSISSRIASYVRSCDYVMADETSLFVIRLNGGKALAVDSEAGKKSYVWVFSSGRGQNRALCYQLGPGRAYDVAKDFLGTGGRYLQSDGYGAYFGIKDAINVPCWSHILRKFTDSARTGRKDYVTESSVIARMISSMLKSDASLQSSAKIAKGTDEFFTEVKEAREKSIRPKMDAIFAEIDRIRPDVIVNSSLGRAVSYALGLREHCYNVFLDGRLELTNNYSERQGVKPMVIGRKNWLFSNTEEGAMVSCDMYTVVRTAAENGLNPELYVRWVLENVPKMETDGFPYDDYLPWSEKIPDWVRSHDPVKK